MFHHATAHVPQADERLSLTCRDAVGALHMLASPFAAVPRDTHAWVAHYFFKSVEEFIWKSVRGRGDLPLSDTVQPVNVSETFMGAFVSQFRANNAVSDARMTACAKGLMAERARILRVPGVAAAREAIIAAYQQWSASLVPSLRLARDTASPTAAEFYDLLLELEPV